MALINYPECNKQISDKASNCPNCGYPVINKIKNPNTNTTKIHCLNCKVQVIVDEPCDKCGEVTSMERYKEYKTIAALGLGCHNCNKIEVEKGGYHMSLNNIYIGEECPDCGKIYYSQEEYDTVGKEWYNASTDRSVKIMKQNILNSRIQKEKETKQKNEAAKKEAEKAKKKNDNIPWFAVGFFGSELKRKEKEKTSLMQDILNELKKK